LCFRWKADFFMKRIKLINNLILVLVGLGLLPLILPIFTINEETVYGFRLFCNTKFIIPYSFSFAGFVCFLFSIKKNDFDIFVVISEALFLIFIFIYKTADFNVVSILWVVDISLVLLFELIKINSLNKLTIREITDMAILVALAIGLDLPGLKIRVGVNGGSISLSMLPLIILSLKFGPSKGFVGCGLVYGFITCVFDGWGLQYYPFDYLLGYGSLCVVGLYKTLFCQENNTFSIKNAIFAGILVFLAMALRLLMSTISGVIFYDLLFIESLAYNALYIVPSGLIMIVLTVFLLKPLIKFKILYSSSN